MCGLPTSFSSRSPGALFAFIFLKALASMALSTIGILNFSPVRSSVTVRNCESCGDCTGLPIAIRLSCVCCNWRTGKLLQSKCPSGNNVGHHQGKRRATACPASSADNGRGGKRAHFYAAAGQDQARWWWTKDKLVDSDTSYAA